MSSLSPTFTSLRRRKQWEHFGFESRPNTSWVTGRPSAWHTYATDSITGFSGADLFSLWAVMRCVLTVTIFLSRSSELLKRCLVYLTSLSQHNLPIRGREQPWHILMHCILAFSRNVRGKITWDLIEFARRYLNPGPSKYYATYRVGPEGVTNLSVSFIFRILNFTISTAEI